MNGLWLAAALSIALVAALVYVGERYGVRLLERWDRVLALKEQKQTDRRAVADDARQERVQERARALREATKGRVMIPPDLDAVILSESAKFAQDEMRASILDSYAVYGNWNKVRTAVGVGHIDDEAA